MWRCSKCGNENTDGFEVCMYCGNIKNATPNQPVAGGLKLKKKSKLLPIILGAVLLVVLILGIVSLSFHSKAKNSFLSGDYQAAIEYAEKDMLFSKRIREDAIQALGDRYMNQRDYAAAVEQYAKLGKKGREDWSDAVYALGGQQMDKQEYEQALETYRLIGEEERGREGVNNALYMCAWNCIYEGRYEDVSPYVEQMDEDYIQKLSANDLFSEIVFVQAKEKLISGNYEQAMSEFRQCKDYGSTVKTMDAIQAIMDGRYYEASCIARDYAGYEGGKLSEYEWAKVFERIKEGSVDGSIETRLDVGAAYAQFVTDRDAIYLGHTKDFERFFPTEYIPSGIEKAIGLDNASFVDASISTKAGGNSEGKILILWQVTDFNTKKTEYAIAWELMDLLPAELYPQDLASAGYVVRVVYGYDNDGWYDFKEDGVFAAIMENGRVIAETAGRRLPVHATTPVKASGAPNSIRVSDIVDNYVSGGAPDVSEMAKKFYETISACIEYEKNN